jgi:hypothetical protein
MDFERSNRIISLSLSRALCTRETTCCPTFLLQFTQAYTYNSKRKSVRENLVP